MQTRRSTRLKPKNEQDEQKEEKKNDEMVKSKKEVAKVEEMEVEQEAKIPPPPAKARPRRSVTAKKPQYSQKTEDEMMELSTSSSSSPDDSDDDSEPIVVAKKRKSPAESTKQDRKRARKNSPIMSESSSDSEEEEEDDDEDSEDQKKPTTSTRRRAPVGKKKMNREDKGDVNWPKCTKASIARKTGNPSGSRTVKSGLRMATKPKPQQPWKKNLSNYEADRKLARGERRMKEYRIVADAYARGKIGEVSYDECFKIHEEMKKAYHEGRKIIEAIEKKERQEETGEKESSSEDEWEEMEHFQPAIDEDKIEVMLEDDEDEGGVEKDWWVVYLRQEINKRIRETWENAHKTHLLCFMAHLKHVVKTALDESLVPSLLVSQLADGFLEYMGEPVPVDVMKKLVFWFTDKFRPLNGVISVTAIQEELKEGHEARFPATSRLTALVNANCYETDLDRATLLFCLLRGMELTARICVNVRPIARKWDAKQQEEVRKELEKFKELSKSRSGSPEVPTTSSDGQKGKKKKKTEKSVEERNYWVEYWHSREKRWICVDPLHKTVDEPLTVHENCALPIFYVFAIDNKQGICEVSQRYAMDCVKQEFRRRRTDQKWLATTLSLPYFAADRQRRQWEQQQMREELIKRPLPKSMAEFKNHPLYVLEKDLLKFEAIYPAPGDQKPLGEIRGHKVYPRSTVFTLQGENNWLKLARSVKIGEKPYKQVKARPDPRIPVEDRVEQFLDVYGYWQTEPYRRPALKPDGRIPCNEYGNVYMFNDNMCPLQCVHLKLPGLVQIARKLDKQCVPAVVGWAFDGGWTHPVMDGAIVLEKDAKAFRKEWDRLEAGRAEREEKKRQEHVYENWRKLIKGMLKMAYVKKQFGHNKKKNEKKTEEVTEDVPETSSSSSHGIIDNGSKIGPLEGFSLDDFIKKR